LAALQDQRGWVTRSLLPERKPGKDKEVNWLPAPKRPFSLTMRIYSPKSHSLTGKWNPPAVHRVQWPARKLTISNDGWGPKG
jgi:hypothetical protein